MTRLREDHVPPRRLLATTVAAVVAVPLAVSIGTATAQAASLAVEVEALSLPTSAGQVFVDRAASGGAALLIWSPGTAAGSATIPASSALVVRARGDQCQGAPLMTVTVDGTSVGTVPVASAVWQDYTLAGAWTAGTHQVRVGYPNDYRDTTCDRNLRVDSVSAVPVEPAAVPVPVVADPTNPFVGARPWVDPQSPASVAAAARRTSDPAGAAALDRVAAGGRADWYSEWASVQAVAASVAARVTTQTAAGALPVLVVYALPHRDCGNYSVGGLPNADAYRAWVAQFASGIGTRKAVVVLEPDALAQMDCLSAADQTERTGLVAGAVRVLSANPGTSVYVDAGNAGWRLPSVMAGRLAAAGVAGARGFSLNVSNFATVASNESYGDAVSALVGRKPFLVDTGRAGAGPGTTWCNPDGRALGPVFTSVTGDPLADGFAWVKPPGNSDGPCNGGPPAGQFWPDYAIGLAQRAP